MTTAAGAGRAATARADSRAAAARIDMGTPEPVPAGAAGPDAAGVACFEKKVRPVLAEHCYACHSKAARKERGRLSLDSREGVLKGGEHGPAVVPGKPDESPLIRAVRYASEDLQMPP